MKKGDEGNLAWGRATARQGVVNLQKFNLSLPSVTFGGHKRS